MPSVSLPLINEQDIAFPLRLSVDPDVGLYVAKVFIENSKYYFTKNIVSLKYVAKIKQLHKFAKKFQYFFKKFFKFFYLRSYFIQRQFLVVFRVLQLSNLFRWLAVYSFPRTQFPFEKC
jgi:hypothetical protein